MELARDRCQSSAPSLCCGASTPSIAHVTFGHRLRESPRQVKSRSNQFGKLRLRSPGGVVPVFLALVCLLAGALHQLRDLQVNAAMFRPAALELLTKNTGPSGKIDISRANVIAEHDKDDSFSVTTPAQVIVAGAIIPSSTSFRQPRTPDSDLIAEIETPPPRYLT
jgi:hypothetical protein